MQTGEGQLHLGLHTSGPRDPATLRLLDQIIKQRRFTYTGLTAHHQSVAFASTNRLDQLIERDTLVTPVP
jgi:hypothetical protein